MLNHIWLMPRCHAPLARCSGDQVAVPNLSDSGGALIGLQKDGNVTPDGYCVNDVQPFYAHSRPIHRLSSGCRRSSPRLSAIAFRMPGSRWAWYAGGWDDAVAGKPAPTFQFHHQPFSYYSRYGEGMPGRAHLQDETHFLNSLADGTCRRSHSSNHSAPSTSMPATRPSKPREPRRRADRSGEGLPFWDGRQSSSPTTTSAAGTTTSRRRQLTAGGPAAGCRPSSSHHGPAQGYVDSTPYDHTSILKFIEWRWDWHRRDRDALAWSLLPAFDFSKSRRS